MTSADVEQLRWASRQLATWFRRHGRAFSWRRADASLYERIVSEVLLQRTRAEVVERFLPGFVDRYPSWQELAKAQHETLVEALRPIGLQDRRATALIGLARHRSKLDGFPGDRDELERIPAVGQYAASAILLFEHGQAEPLLDSNMARILERFSQRRTKADLRTDPFLQQGSRVLIEPDPLVVNWAALDHGALVCQPRSPRCDECPLAVRCRQLGVNRDVS